MECNCYGNFHQIYTTKFTKIAEYFIRKQKLQCFTTHAANWGLRHLPKQASNNPWH